MHKEKNGNWKLINLVNIYINLIKWVELKIEKKWWMNHWIFLFCILFLYIFLCIRFLYILFHAIYSEIRFFSYDSIKFLANFFSALFCVSLCERTVFPTYFKSWLYCAVDKTQIEGVRDQAVLVTEFETKGAKGVLKRCYAIQYI
jgi:hypothetical protein